MGRTYRTAQGKTIDLEKLKLQNELVQAVGNMQVNARGDQLGTGGQVVKTREQMVDQHYQNNTVKRRKVDDDNAIPTRGGKANDIEADAPASVVPVAPTKKKTKAAPAPKEEPVAEPDPVVEEPVAEPDPVVEESPKPTNTYEFTGDSEEAAILEPTPETDKISGVSKGESSLKGGLARAVAKTRSYENQKNKPKRI